MGLSAPELLTALQAAFPAAIVGHRDFRDDLTIMVHPGRIADIIRFLRDEPELSFSMLTDIAGIDAIGLGRPDRFEVVYLLKSLKYGHRLQVSCALPGEQPSLPSIAGLYGIADWLEREVWDQFGIVFNGHPNLKRLLNHKDFQGHPLRKDYPIDRRQELASNDDLLEEMKNKLAAMGLLDTATERAVTAEIKAGDDASRAGSVEEIIRQLGQRTPGSLSGFFMVNFGPAHPVVHGILRLLLTLEGESIVAAVPEIGYLHRGFEKSAESVTYAQVIPFTDRLNYASAAMNNIGFCRAVEKLLSIEIPERAVLLRVIFAELSRIMDHLLCTGPNLVDLGALTPFWYMFQVREIMYDLLEKYCGARLTYSCVRIGGMPADVYPGFSNDVEAALARLQQAIDDVRALVERNRIFMDRCMNVGVISREDAVSHGFTGPCLRATGIAHDLRKAEPYYHYDEFSFETVTGSRGDTYDRFFVRIYEMIESTKIIRQALRRLDALGPGPVMVDDPLVALPPKAQVYTSMESMIDHFELIVHGIKPPPGQIYSCTEAANGELGFYLVSDGSSRPYRVKVRPPCLMVYSAFEKMIQGGMIADLVATLGSLNIVGGEIDR